jgi:hypothetical protein
MLILEDLNFRIDRQKKVEDEVEVVHEKTRKMEDAMKNIEEHDKRI